MSLYQQQYVVDDLPALVLLHGWGMNGDIWQPLIEQLAQSYSVYIPDLPGLGRSPAYTESDSFQLMAEQLLAQLPEQAHWLGWSLGGTVATYIAAHYPQRVLSLTTVASNPCYVQRDDWPCAMPEPTFRAFSAAVASDPAKALTRFSMLQVQGAADSRHCLRRLKSLLSDTTLPASLNETLALLALDCRPLLANLQCPWLAIWGEQDQLVPVSIAEPLSRLHPAIQQCCFSDSAHLPFISEQQRFTDELQRFLSES